MATRSNPQAMDCQRNCCNQMAGFRVTTEEAAVPPVPVPAGTRPHPNFTKVHQELKSNRRSMGPNIFCEYQCKYKHVLVPFPTEKVLVSGAISRPGGFRANA